MWIIWYIGMMASLRAMGLAPGVVPVRTWTDAAGAAAAEAGNSAPARMIAKSRERDFSSKSTLT